MKRLPIVAVVLIPLLLIVVFAAGRRSTDVIPLAPSKVDPALAVAMQPEIDKARRLIEEARTKQEFDQAWATADAGGLIITRYGKPGEGEAYRAMLEPLRTEYASRRGSLP